LLHFHSKDLISFYQPTFVQNKNCLRAWLLGIRQLLACISCILLLNN
jgi:hypothetical protein